MPRRRPHSPPPPRDSQWFTATLEEYRQVYALALFRLTALEQRIPVAGATLTAMLGTVGVLPIPVQIALLVGLPFSLLWLVRTTVNHVRSFEDAIRRIELIERAVNRRVGDGAMVFQSSHPSRNRTVGGRTGTETLEAVLAASAILLAASLYLFRQMLSPTPIELAAYSCLIATIAAALLVFRKRLWRYRYQPNPTTPSP